MLKAQTRIIPNVLVAIAISAHRVLFLCAKNDLYSPMAEALLNKLDSPHFEVMSAGIDRGEMHPIMVEVMKEIGIDLERRVAKATRRRVGSKFRLCDYVVRLGET